MDNKDLLKDFSPQFIAQGIAGLFATGEYESVEIKLTFNKKRRAAENSGAVAEQPTTAPCQNNGEELGRNHFSLKAVTSA